MMNLTSATCQYLFTNYQLKKTCGNVVLILLSVNLEVGIYNLGTDRQHEEFGFK